MSDHTATAGVDDAAARFQIKTAGDNYALGLDTRDLDRFLLAWHDDATWSVDHPPTVCRGHDEIAAYTKAAWAEMKVINHFTMNDIVEFDGDRATGLSHSSAMLVTRDGLYVTAAALYHDAFEQRDGVWRLSSREVINNHWVEHPQAVVTTDFGAAESGTRP